MSTSILHMHMDKNTDTHLHVCTQSTQKHARTHIHCVSLFILVTMAGEKPFKRREDFWLMVYLAPVLRDWASWQKHGSEADALKNGRQKTEKTKTGTDRHCQGLLPQPTLTNQTLFSVPIASQPLRNCEPIKSRALGISHYLKPMSNSPTITQACRQHFTLKPQQINLLSTASEPERWRAGTAWTPWVLSQCQEGPETSQTCLGF